MLMLMLMLTMGEAWAVTPKKLLRSTIEERDTSTIVAYCCVFETSARPPSRFLVAVPARLPRPLQTVLLPLAWRLRDPPKVADVLPYLPVASVYVFRFFKGGPRS